MKTYPTLTRWIWGLALGGGLLAAGSLRAEVLWREDFEDPQVEEYWYADFGIWEFGAPRSGPTNVVSGTRLGGTVLGGNYPDNVTSRLIRDEAFEVPPAEENPRLRFWHWHACANNDVGYAQIREAGGEWRSLAIYSATSSGGWEFASLDLSAYAGKTVQVGFLFQSRQTQDGYGNWVNTVAAGWYLDRVEVFSGPMSFRNPEGFEADDVWDHWVADNGIWEVGVPMSGPGAAYAGDKVVGTILQGNYADGYTSRLISPPLTVPTEPNPRLRFWHWRALAQGDAATVLIAEPRGEWRTLATYTGTSAGGWELASLDLSSYAGKTVQVSFRFLSLQSQDRYGNWVATVAAGWYLDQVEVFSGPMSFRNPEGFETSDVWDHWVADNGIWESGVPLSGPATAKVGAQVVGTVLDGPYADGYDSRLISPPLTVPSEPNPRLRFWHWHAFSYSDTGNVQLREMGGEWKTLATYSWASSGGWEFASLDLSAYAGKTVQMGFLFQSRLTQDAYGNWLPSVAAGWYLDQVEVISGPMVYRNPEGFEADDVWDHWVADNGIWEVGVPKSGPGAARVGTHVVGTILNGNYADGYDSRLISPPVPVPAGPNPRLRFWHWHAFAENDTGLVQIRELGKDWLTLATYTGSGMGGWEFASLNMLFFAGKTVQVSFLFQSRQTQDWYGNWVSNVAAGWYLDQVEFMSGPMVFRNPEGFETDDVWDHWVADNGIWEAGVPTSGPGAAYVGTKVCGTVLKGDYADGYDSRLISPPLLVPTGLNPRLRFRHWYSFNSGDLGKVQLRVQGQGWIDLAQYTNSSAGWAYPLMPLSEYAGKTLQFGFLFQSRQSQDRYGHWVSAVAPGWYLDDVKILTDALQVARQWTTHELSLVSFAASSSLVGGRYGLASGAPEGARIDPELGVFTWIPSECQGPSTNLITVNLFDPQNALLQPVDFEIVTVTILENNEPPILSPIPSLRFASGVPNTFALAPYLYDPDCPSQPLLYTLEEGSAAGATIHPGTGVVRWTPTSEQATRTNYFYLRVTDPGDPPYSVQQVIEVCPGGGASLVVRDFRLQGRTLEFSLGDAQAGSEYALESTAELTAPAELIQWQTVRPFTWQANPVRLEQVLTGGQPREFFRIQKRP